MCSLRDKNKMAHRSKKAIFGKQHFRQGECMVREGGRNIKKLFLIVSKNNS
jgi:hypothetical protein